MMKEWGGYYRSIYESKCIIKEVYDDEGNDEDIIDLFMKAGGNRTSYLIGN